MAATANVFALLGGDGDDDIQQLAEKAAPLIKEKAPAAPAPAASKPEPRADAGRGGRGDRGRGDRGRGGRGYGRGPREALPNGVEDPVSDERGEGGRGRGRGRGGRGRGNYDGARPPRREYERRDGTGRGHEVQKRGGAGVGNWGTAADDTNAAAAPEEVRPEGEEAAAAAPAAEAPAAEAGAEAAAPAEPEPEPVKEMTLEEYEKQLAEKKAALNKSGEVKQVSMDEFKGMKAVVRKEPEETIPGLEITKKKADKAAKQASEEAKEKPKKQVNTIETGFRIADNSDAGRGGRGPRGGRGRGEGRGDRPMSGRGRGEGRGEGRGDRAPREGGRGGARGPGRELPINDASAFPSLA